MEEVRPSVQRGRHGFRAHSGKKAANGNGFPPARTVYDDVFGGPPKYTVPSFPPCVDDYAEIFHGPSLAQKTPPVPFLVLASDYDGEDSVVTDDSYADIFGGVACDFTVSLEELLGRSQAKVEKKGFRDDSAKKGYHVVDGEKKPLEKIPTKMSGTRVNNSKEVFSSILEVSVATEFAYQKLHGNQKQLDGSTLMINHKSKENYQREMRVSELNADSECTVVVDSDLPSVEIHNINNNTNENIASTVTEKVAEIKFGNSVDLKSTKRTLSNGSKDNFPPKIFRHEFKEESINGRLKPYQLEDGSCVNSHAYSSYDDCGVDKYNPRDIFLSVKEISLQTQPTDLPPPTRPPPKLGTKHGDSNKQGVSEERLGTRTNELCERGDLLNGRYNSRRDHVMSISGACSAEEVSKQGSPRFLDVEVDMNSAAAISAAAMKEVMEEAKAKLKLAKEFRERRRNNLKSNKKLVDREGKKNKEKEKSDGERKKNKEQEEFDSAQEFFECTLVMTHDVSDCEFKECFQEHKEKRPPKRDSIYPEKQRCLDLAEECAKKNMGNGPKFDEEPDKNKTAEETSCHDQYRHEEMAAVPLDFKLKEAQRSFVLVQKCTEGKARKGTGLVADCHGQKTNRREHGAEEVHICKVDEKMENAAVEICEGKQNEKKVESAQSSHVTEDGMGKQIMSEHCTDMRAVQKTQQHNENEKVETENKNWGGNEGDGKVTTTGEIHQHGASLDRLETVQDFMKPEKMDPIEQMAAQELTGLEETLQQEKIMESFASILDTHDEECSNRWRISQEDTYEEECSNRWSTSQEDTQKEDFSNRWTTFQEDTHEEECSNRPKTSQGIAREEEVHEDNEKAALERMQQQEKKKELKIVQGESKTNERQEQIAASREPHEQGGSSHGAATTQESREQDEVHENNEKILQQEEIVDSFVSILQTHDEECSNRWRTSQEDTHEEECSNRWSTSQEDTHKEEFSNRWTTFQEDTHEECSNRPKTSQGIAREEEVHEDNEKVALERMQQQEKKKELKIVQGESKTNERQEQIAASREPHEQGGSSHEAATTQESRKQDEVHENNEKILQQEEIVESFASILHTHDEECSNRWRTSQEDTHEEECSNRWSTSQEDTHKEEFSNRWTAFQEDTHEEECSNRPKTSQGIAREEEVHEDNEKVALERVQQQEKKKELKIVQGESKTNERQEQIAASREPHEQGGSSHGAATTQESREQDEVHENNEKILQQEEEKLIPGDMERERNEEEEISATGKICQDNESSNDSKTAEVSIKLDEILKNEKDVSREEVQLQEEMDKQINVGQDCQGNEKQEELAKQRDETNGRNDVQEFRKQEEIQKNKQKIAEETVFQEENINKKVIEAAAHKHKQNEKSFQILVDGEDPVAKNIRQNNAQATSVQEIKEKKVEEAPHLNKLEGKDKILKMSHKINEIQGVKQKTRKFNEIHEKAEKEKSQLEKERLKRDREQEMERLMKLEEEKEREREREKDRIAVERATHEACDKSVADAWDKAEKAAVERATAEAREKSPFEPKVVDRTSAEGRFRAERSAVDKATVEARERAAERAIVEKVAAEARERMERAVVERFAASVRDKHKKDNEREDGMSMRMNGAKSVTDEVQNTRDTSSNETEKRRKARLDRYQRTTERAAKALAEKKDRDILAQREQAERNRLADSLDGDVKRWSNGKEGNLRALLSTLQYILGPESGWQPAPLTEIITSAAVKRAYRKATLCVHPDKVQQRGASVQQKYICEKVFDLLKEAWNKFNSER